MSTSAHHTGTLDIYLACVKDAKQTSLGMYPTGLHAPLVLLQFPSLLAVTAERAAWLLPLTVGFLSFLGQFQ